MDKSTMRAYRFFHENAVGIVGERAIGAMLQVRAEREAAERDWCFCWEPDYDDSADGNTTPRERFSCLLRDFEGNVLARLGSIGDPSPDYCRVIEAELAAEALSVMHLTGKRQWTWAKYW
jgi:hypothetical protein